MTILDEIVLQKKREVEERKKRVAIKNLEQSVYFNSPVVSLKQALLSNTKSGIIAEYKRKSPSKGIINQNANVEDVTCGYQHAGAVAVSILTDYEFFGGMNSDVSSARKNLSIPILRKEFIIDEYQIVETKSIGANSILLIASILNKNAVKQFTSLANAIGLEVLLEVRDREELDLIGEVECVGVNNRNLKDFKVDVEQSFTLAEYIPADRVKISESGIDSPATLQQLKKAGYQGFLMGECFMNQPRPANACKQFIHDLNAMK
jgi:indole-3-glycerol phosphate synthase